MSTSSKTTTGALPPSSRWTRLSVSAAALRDPLAGLERAGQRDHVDVGVGDERRARRLAVAGDHVEHARREDAPPPARPACSVVSGVVSAGLSTIVLPAASAGPIFQIGHHQRVVPRRDLADDADRLAPDHRRVALDVLARRLALHAARGAGEEAQVVDHERDLVLEEGVARLAGVGRLEVGELVGVLLDRVGELRAAPASARRASSSTSRRTPRVAAATARSTSSAVDSGASAIASPVAGLRTVSVAPSAGSTNSPSMKFWSLVWCAVPSSPPFSARV